MERFRDNGSSPEIVYLISSHRFHCNSATEMLEDKRGYWTIENGFHQRLDVAADEDRSRVRTQTAPLVLAMFRRLPFAFYTRWMMHQPERRRSLRDFYDAMSERNHRWAFRLLTRSSPRRLVDSPPP